MVALTVNTGMFGIGACAAAAVIAVFTPASSDVTARGTTRIPGSAAVEVQECVAAKIGDICEPNGVPSMLGYYLACLKLARVRILSQTEAFACTEAFLAVKLSFVAGFDPSSYRRLPLEERVEMNRRAYLAYRSWNKKLPRHTRTICLRGQQCDT